MPLGRAYRDDKVFCDCAVGQSLSNQFRNLLLTPSKSNRLGRRCVRDSAMLVERVRDSFTLGHHKSPVKLLVESTLTQCLLSIVCSLVMVG